MKRARATGHDDPPDPLGCLALLVAVVLAWAAIIAGAVWVWPW